MSMLTCLRCQKEYSDAFQLVALCPELQLTAGNTTC